MRATPSAIRAILAAAVALLLGQGLPACAADEARPAVPVRLDGETIFEVRVPLGPLSAEERAEAAEHRVLNLAEDPFYSANLLTIEDSNNQTRILYAERTLGTVTDDDAAGTGMTRVELARRAVSLVRSSIDSYHERRRPAAELRGWIVFGVATAILIAFLLLIRWAFRRLTERFETASPRDVTARLERLLSIPDDRVVLVKKRALAVLRIAVTVVGVLIYLQVAFTLFPLTRGYALAVLRYIFDPLADLWDGLLANISGLFSAAVLAVLAYYVLKGLRWLFGEISAGRISIPGVNPAWSMPLYKMLRIVVIALAVVMIYPYIPGSNTLAFKGVGLFAGALLSLGASGTIGNFLGGLVAMFAGAFGPGDWVKIGDVTGEVLEMTLLLTRIRTQRDEVVTVPNASILATPVVNYSARARDEGVILHTAVTIGYDAPWRQVHELLLKAAAATSLIEKQPAPFVLQTALNDFFITYEINAYTREPVRTPWIYGELHQNIQDAFNEAGVEIMSPHFSALRDGNTIAIPEKSRTPGEAPRKFQVRVEQ